MLDAGCYIGLKYGNRWWENLVMVVSCWGAYGAIRSVWDELHKPLPPLATVPASCLQ